MNKAIPGEMNCNKLRGKKVRWFKFWKECSLTKVKHKLWRQVQILKVLTFHTVFQFSNYKLELESVKSLGYLSPVALSNFLTGSYAFCSVSSQREAVFPTPLRFWNSTTNTLSYEACADLPRGSLEHADRICQYTGQGQRVKWHSLRFKKAPVVQCLRYQSQCFI